MKSERAMHQVGRGLRPRRERDLAHAAHSERAPYLTPMPAVLLPVLVAGLWPVWRWFIARTADGSDEPLGLIALATAAWFLPRSGWFKPIPPRRLILALTALVAYLATFHALPPLIRAVLALSALVAIAPHDTRRATLPWFALLVLSLPLIATLQYVFGFPVRVATGWCSAHLLALAGLAVEARGTVLHWAGETVLIDAPCSGIRMLWTAAVMSAALACLHRLPARRFLLLAQCTSAVVFVGNVVRSTVLFLLETNIWPNPPWAHEATGLAVFAVALGACTVAAHRLARTPAVGPPQPIATTPPIPHATGRAWFFGWTVAAAGIAGVLPIAGRDDSAPRPAGTIDWPTTFEGVPLERAPLHPIEARFAEGFPGEFAAFTDGHRRIVFRAITQATRKVHPAAGCLRASGYDVTPRPALRHPDSGLWSVVEARQDAETLIVREHIEGTAGQSWTDVSAWYWSAVFRPETGPWLAVTVIEGH